MTTYTTRQLWQLITYFPLTPPGHLSRLHMILKPFMLRRIKKDVENELSDKIEIMVYCPLTSRQKLLYSGNPITHTYYKVYSVNFIGQHFDTTLQKKKSDSSHTLSHESSLILHKLIIIFLGHFRLPVLITRASYTGCPGLNLNCPRQLRQ